MIGHTEEQARGSWCPFARTITYERDDSLGPLDADGEPVGQWHHTPAHNRLRVDADDKEDDVLASDSRCVGSKCMAWRWLSSKAFENMPRGYCGLAGHPFPMLALDAGGPRP